jgi:hypothetical protein
MTTDDPPSGLDERGRAFWTKITTDYELAPDEAELLTEAARTLDLCDRLDADPDEVRSLLTARSLLGRLLGQLKIPGGVETTMTARARTAATARWAAPADDTSRKAQAAAWSRWHPAAPGA